MTVIRYNNGRTTRERRFANHTLAKRAVESLSRKGFRVWSWEVR